LGTIYTSQGHISLRLAAFGRPTQVIEGANTAFNGVWASSIAQYLVTTVIGSQLRVHRNGPPQPCVRNIPCRDRYHEFEY
jgi:hypothetical protein